MSKSNTNPRPKPAKENAKTALCKAFAATGECKFGAQCTFAHGVDELRRPKRTKIDKPCWWHNNGGCTKSADECVYQHIIVENIRKPIHLQHPCVWMHARTPGVCRNGKGCGGDHDYELTAEEWKHHFPHIEYRGVGYLKPPQQQQQQQQQQPRQQRPSIRAKAMIKPQITIDDQEEFPVLATAIKAVQPHPVWSQPLSVIKEAPPQMTASKKRPLAYPVACGNPDHELDDLSLEDEVDDEEVVAEDLSDSGPPTPYDEVEEIVNGRFNTDSPIFIPSRPLNPNATIFTPMDQRHLTNLVNNALQQLLNGNDVFA